MRSPSWAQLLQAALAALPAVSFSPGVAQAQSQSATFIGTSGAQNAISLPAGTVVLQADPSPGTAVLVPSGAPASSPVYFLNGGTVTGPGTRLDLATLVNRTLKLQSIPASAKEASDDEARATRTPLGDKTFIIGPEARGAARGVLLPGGASGELGDVRLPFIRVKVTAPDGKPLDVQALVARRPQVGIFNALFVPVTARTGAAPVTAIALAQPEAPKPAPSAAPAVEHAVVTAAAMQPAPRMSVATVASAHAIMAFTAPVEELSKLHSPIPPAAVEDRPVVAAAQAPVEDRLLVALELVPAPVEERAMPVTLADVALAAVEERPVMVPSAPVEDRLLVALELVPAPVEERAMPVTLAAVEERPVTTPSAPVEERFLVALKLVPAPVEDRSTVRPASAPVEERMLVALELVPAPVEERIASPIVRASYAPPVEPVRRFEPVQVASVANVPVVIVSAKAQPESSHPAEPASPPVRLAAIQKKLPQIMIDRRGGLFFM